MQRKYPNNSTTPASSGWTPPVPYAGTPYAGAERVPNVPGGIRYEIPRYKLPDGRIVGQFEIDGYMKKYRPKPQYAPRSTTNLMALIRMRNQAPTTTMNGIPLR